MSISTGIGLRLKAARKAAKFRTACSFAKKYKIPISTYAQHENGARVLNADTLLYYSDLLNIDAGWLLSGKGKPYQGGVTDADRAAVIACELFTLEKNPINQPDLLPIDEGISLVDVNLLREIMLRFIALLKTVAVKTDEADLVSFVLEIYNGVVMTSATADDRLAMINLSVASLKRVVSMTGMQFEAPKKASA